MVQQQTSLNLTPASSTPAYNRPVSVSLPTPPLVAEELGDNRFYVYLRSRFNAIFTSHSVVCIPHSSYLEDRYLTKAFIGKSNKEYMFIYHPTTTNFYCYFCFGIIETHCFNASPYYRGQYQAANGKVISIEIPEIPILSTVSGKLKKKIGKRTLNMTHQLFDTGFKEQRTIRIMSEEWVYDDKKKIRVFMIQGLLEGEAMVSECI